MKRNHSSSALTSAPKKTNSLITECDARTAGKYRRCRHLYLKYKDRTVMTYAQFVFVYDHLRANPVFEGYDIELDVSTESGFVFRVPGHPLGYKPLRFTYAIRASSFRWPICKEWKESWRGIAEEAWIFHTWGRGEKSVMGFDARCTNNTCAWSDEELSAVGDALIATGLFKRDRRGKYFS